MANPNTSCNFAFFSDSVFDQSKNGVYENMYAYMNSHTPTYSTEYKFIKPQLQITLKLPLNSHMDIYQLGNYCVQTVTMPTDITSDEKWSGQQYYFYYVKDVTWKALMTVEVTLVMDTLTCLGYMSKIENRLSETSHITRKFKDRWKWSDTDSKFIPLVDDYDEGFGTLPMRKNDELAVYGVVRDKDWNPGWSPLPSETATTCRWYLVYRSQYTDEDNIKNNPVDALLFPSVAIWVASGKTGSVAWEPSMIPLNTRYILTDKRNHGQTVTITDTSAGTVTLTLGNTYSSTSDATLEALGIWRIASNPDKFIVMYRSSKGTTGSYTQGQAVEFKDVDTIYKQTTVDFDDWTWDDLEYYTPVEINAGQPYTKLSSFDDWYKTNKTDGRLVKIREIPYPPFTPVIDSARNLTIPSDWKINSDLGLTFTGTSFDYDKLGATCFNLFTIDKQYVLDNTAPSIEFETKLSYNSQFVTYKFVYDSNAFALELERFEDAQTNGLNKAIYDIYYYVSDGMDDGMMWQFDIPQRIDTDFGKYMYVSKVTDVPYYNSEYLNYLRYGKDVDERNAATTVAGAIVSGAGSILSGVASGAFAGAAITGATGGGGAILAGAITAATSIISLTNTCISARDTINSKIDQYTHQAATVSAGSDISLFRRYGMNKLLWMQYQPMPEIKEAIYQYLRLYGYACDEYARPVRSRKYVDYFKGEFEFVSATQRSWEKDILEDAKARMDAGFRIFHPYDDENDKTTWDTSLSKENWETSVWEKANS